MTALLAAGRRVFDPGLPQRHVLRSGISELLHPRVTHPPIRLDRDNKRVTHHPANTIPSAIHLTRNDLAVCGVELAAHAKRDEHNNKHGTGTVMEGIYKSIQEKCKAQYTCPICMVYMGREALRFSCKNGHIVCQNCKPYYYACPTCRSSLDIKIRLPPLPNMRCPYPFPGSTEDDDESDPETPPPQEKELEQCAFSHAGCEAKFPAQQRQIHEKTCRFRPNPKKDQELKHCVFSHAGCGARLPEHLREIHESRCQLRPFLEERRRSTDLVYDRDDLIECKYHAAGCDASIPHWRKIVHEEICIYKDKGDASHGSENTDAK